VLMNDKLKLPLTAVFSFLLGGIVFFPWGANDQNSVVNQTTLNTNFIFDEIAAVKPEVDSAEVVTRVAPTIIVDYRFSEDELKVSNLAISNQLKGVVNTVVSQKTEVVVKNNSTTAQTIVVEYSFSEDDLKISNLVIKKQLRSFISEVNNEQVVSLSERLNSTNTITPNSIKKVDYHFSNDAIKLSNLTIEKQLSRYLADNKQVEITNSHNINDIEVSEKSETDLFVKDVANYSNDSDNTNTSELENETDEIAQEDTNEIENYAHSQFSQSEIEISNQIITTQLRNYKEIEISEKPEINVIKILVIRKTTPVNFSGTKLEFSKLTILKQLKGYINALAVDSHDDEPQANENFVSNLDDIDDAEATVGLSELQTAETNLPVNNEYEDENDLLLSNSEHDDDDEEYSGTLIKYQLRAPVDEKTLSSLSEDDATTEEQHEDEDDDDEEEFSSERIVFNVEPRYFIDSFEIESTANLENNIEVPEIENIKQNSKLDFSIEEIEVIEEIEINDNDNGKIITSSVERY